MRYWVVEGTRDADQRWNVFLRILQHLLGYNPRRWNANHVAIAAWSSFPGMPAGAVTIFVQLQVVMLKQKTTN